MLDLGLSHEPAADGWSSALLFRLLADLAPGARTALRYICEHAPAVGFDEVAAHLGQPIVDGRSTGQLGGTMTSLRAALRRIPGSPSSPVTRDSAARMYVFDEKIATLLRDAFAVADRQPQLLRS